MMSEPIAPFQRHSDTSYAAAKAIAPHAGAQRARVYATLVAYGPSTQEQLSDALGLGGDSVRPRTIELRRRGLVVDSGLRRRTRSGRWAVVWMAKDEDTAE